MSGSVRPEFDPASLDAAVKSLKAQGAPDEAVHAYLVSKGLQPVDEKPQGSLVSRVGEKVGGALKQIMHPVDMVKGMAKGALSDLSTIGENMNAGMGQPNQNTPTIAKQLPGALARTGTTLAFPGIAGGVAGKLGGGMLARAAGLATAGGAVGASQDEKDPVAGGLAGGLLAPLFGGAGEVLGHVAGRAGSTVMDQVGRPAESRPFIKAGPVQYGRVEGMVDRAARLNAPATANAPQMPTMDGKPLTPADVGGIPAQRMLRGLKTSSPGAEAVARDALEPRGDAAVQRVIDHAKELTGIKRADAYTTHEQLKEQTNANGNESYGKVWAAEGNKPVPLSPEYESVLNRPAMQKALPIGAEIRANFGEKQAVTRPPSIPPDQWEMLQKAGIGGHGLTVMQDGQPPHTLADLHGAKLGLDDMERALRGRGTGSGNNQARGVAATKADLLKVMDKHNADYGTSRNGFADDKSLEDASTLGSDHWTRDPVESKALLGKMTDGEQKIYRDIAFDKWSGHVENGAEDVAKAQSKPRNLARLRALFPDDASFGQFQEGLQHEATMHATQKGVLSGSNTADKLSDMAGMAGVTLPEVFHAAMGRPQRLIMGAAGRAMKAINREPADQLAVERAKLLTAGADGDASARQAALHRMLPPQPTQPQLPIKTGGLMTAAMGDQKP